MNRRPPEFNKTLGVESLLVKAFGKKQVRTEAELRRELSKFPVVKSKDEARQFLKVGVDLKLLKPFTKNRRRFYEA